MRLNQCFAAILLASCCVDGVVGRHALQRRQDSTADSSPSTTDSAATSSPTVSSDSATSTAQSSDPSSTTSSDSASTSDETSSPTTTTDSSPTTTQDSSDNAATSAITVPGSYTTSAQDSTATGARHAKSELPFQPTITPALGVAGAILLCAGVALALIGIKHDWLHVVLSTALLASLSVTVLVVYVMNPPVSNAVQGAYFVAALLTGLILGALSLVFKEVTEGLGCLLGGYCLAMWFLVLSPGGLIQSTSGRAVLIAVFCLACLALSFSRYTRNYGLIFCTSFAGATATIVGIDCFSCAGLKEFWLYLWNLNDDIFPIGTTTYPITKGIRVEIACTVIIFLFGVMSQFKIWKVVKERRKRQDAERLRDDEDRDQLESRVGKEVEASNNRERRQWEAVYGEKQGKQPNTDSGVGSSMGSFRKSSVNVQEREVDGVELVEMPGVSSKRSSRIGKQATATVRMAPEDENEDVATAEHSQENLLGVNTHSRASSHRAASSYRSLREKNSQTSMMSHDFESAHDSQGHSATSGPPVVPLPFSPPVEEDEESDRQSVTSKGTAGQSVYERRGIRLNQLSLRKKEEQERESMLLPRIEDDRASSIAATADGDADADRLSDQRLSALPSTYKLRNPSRDSLMVLSTDGRSRSASPSARLNAEKPVDEDDDEVIARPETAQDTHEEMASKIAKQHKRRSTASNRLLRDNDSDRDHDSASVAGPLIDHLPQKFSKVAMAYRTNEWAKHITDADTPDVEEESGSHSPGIQVDTGFAHEAARPVNIEELQSSTPVEQSVQPARDVSRRNSSIPFTRSTSASNLLVRKPSGSPATPVYAAQRSESQMSMRRQNSSSSMANPMIVTRVASGPLASQPLVESPTEGDIDGMGPYRDSASPALGSSGNLMDQRNTMLKRKPTTQSFMGPSQSTTNLINVIAPSDSASSRNVPTTDEPDSDNISLSDRKQQLDEEEMTLAQRKELMQQRAAEQQRQTMQSPAFARQTSNATQYRRHSYTPQVQVSRQNSVQATGGVIYDSHQPKRGNTIDYAKQNTIMSQWRNTLQQEQSVKPPLIAEESARQHLLSDRRQKEWEQQRQVQERANRESVMDMAMRSGHLHNAHQDAMRRMQAKANKKAS